MPARTPSITFACLISLLVSGIAQGQAGDPAITPPPAKLAREAERPAQRAESARIDLRPRFEIGRAVRYALSQKSEQFVPNPDDPNHPHKNTLDQTVGLKMTTTAIDNESGQTTIEVVYESVKARLDGSVVSVEFDSTKKPVSPVTPAATTGKTADPLDALDHLVVERFRSMVGTTLTLKVARDGRIISVTGGESLSAARIPGLTVPTADAARQLGGLFGPMTTNTTPGFDGTARVGERWNHLDTLQVAPLGGLEMSTTYDLRSHSANLAKVFFSGRVAGQHSSGGISPAPAPITVESAEHTGQYAWDTRLGELVRCEIEQKTTMSGSLTGGKPSTATSRVVLERVKGR